MTSISSEELRVLTQYIYAISGVSLDASKAYLVETRLKSMLQQYACSSYMDLYNKAKADRSGNMEKEIVNAITTNETLFFRDSAPFEMFKYKILPEIIDARSKNGAGRPVPIRIWSAACSTGQEVYSIAIALRETLGNLSGYQISILGTDISDEAVAKASYGKYNKFEIERGLPPQTLNKYFTLMGDGWKIKDDIRSMAVFKKFNLMKPFAGMGRFDVVFCRNVAIYFTPSDKKAVFEKIATILEPDGALVIGSTESLTGVTNVFETKRYMRSIFYQPVRGGESSVALNQNVMRTASSLPARPATVPAASVAAARPSMPASRAPVSLAPQTSPSGAIPPPAPSQPPRPAQQPAAVVSPRPAAPIAPVVPPPAAFAPPAPSGQIAAVQVVADELAPVEEPEYDMKSRTTPSTPRPPISRPVAGPAPVVGDKSALKRLLMQKKQQARS